MAIRFQRVNELFRPQVADLTRLQREYPQFAQDFLLQEEKVRRHPPASFRPFGQAVQS